MLRITSGVALQIETAAGEDRWASVGGAKLKRRPRLSPAELRARGTLEFVKAR